MSRRPGAFRRVGQRSWLFLALIVVGVVYATVTGRWLALLYFLLRLA